MIRYDEPEWFSRRSPNFKLISESDYPMDPRGLFIVAAGIFSIMGGVFDWDWFFNSSKGQLWVSILGRNGARGFFVVLGLGLTILGALITLKVLS